MEIWNSVSEQLQEVINNAFDELEILEQCFEKSKSLKECMKRASSPDRLPGANKVSPSRAGVSLLKPQEDAKKTRKDAVTSSPIRLETINDLDSNLNLKDVTPEIKDLSGRVLIVNESPTTHPSSDNNSDCHETTTVTVLKMGADNEVQFGLTRVEEECDEEDADGNLDDEDQFADTISLKITPEMAGVRTVTVNEAPETVDEAVNKVKRLKPDGSEEVVFQCEMCSKSFITAASLTSHRWQHTKPFQCESCKERFASKGNLSLIHI